MWMDIGKLIRESAPDKNGKTLPKDLTSGSYEFRDLTNTGIGTLFEGKVIYDKTYGHVTYGCATCCGYNAALLWYDPILLAYLGSGVGDGVWGYSVCDQQYEDVSTSFYGNWHSANTSIITVDSYGVHSPHNVGSTTSSTSGYLESTAHYPTCPAIYRSPGGGGNVKPTITSISPARGLIGATTSSVTISGEGFSGGHVNTPAAIQVSNITTSTDTQITFDAVISGTATPGNNAGAISVTTSGQTSNAKDFYVQVPTSLSMVAGTAGGTSETACTLNACGTLVHFVYQVNDQDSTPQPIKASMSMWDSFGTFNPDGLSLNGPPQNTTCTPVNTGPCGVFTGTDGKFTEGQLGGCSTVCVVNGACAAGGPSDITETWHIAGHAIAQQISMYCQKVLVNGVQVQ